MADEATTTAPDSATLVARIWEIVADHSGMTSFDDVGDADDLFAAGMTSLGVVRVLVALEDAFGVEFPDELLSRQTFSSVGSIAEALTKMQTASPQ